MFSEWMDFSISALITDCRYAGLQDSRAMLRRLDHSGLKFLKIRNPNGSALCNGAQGGQSDNNTKGISK
jgi:hypothetical protein